MPKRIPQDLQGILWSRKIDQLDLKKSRDYVVHQILAYGSLEQINWLFNTFSKKQVIQSFLNSPQKNYSPSAFNFVKNYLLGLENQQVKPQAYVKALS
jgi:hypothetical protein